MSSTIVPAHKDPIHADRFLPTPQMNKMTKRIGYTSAALIFIGVIGCVGAAIAMGVGRYPTHVRLIPYAAGLGLIGAGALGFALVFNMEKIDQGYKKREKGFILDTWFTSHLDEAVKRRQHFWMRILLTLGAHPNIPNDKNLLTHQVARTGDAVAFQMLVDFGADYKAEDRNGNTPYAIASLEVNSEGHKKIVKIIDNLMKNKVN